ncbi:MAG: vanadium-dependent haloperoxidase [Verrucomicrobiota bacterium]
MLTRAKHLVLYAFLLHLVPSGYGQSVARLWNEELLAAIRIDFPAPTVHARNLFHTSAAMYDAWAAYTTNAVGYLHNESISTTNNVETARAEAISFAAYRVLVKRYSLAVDPMTTLALLDNRMTLLGYDSSNTNRIGTTPAALGNRVADTIISYGLTDGANETFNYADTTAYLPVNDPMILPQPFDPADISHHNRWQPLAFDIRITQNGLVADQIQTFVGPHWGRVQPFAMNPVSPGGLYHDPGPPPQLETSIFKENNLAVIRFSRRLDPDAGDFLDISPGARGNNPLGTNDGLGHPLNPVTGLPYAPNSVNHADYGRVVAEFWADGPASETPPGHWNVLFNEVADDPGIIKHIGGTGAVVNDLEWDVKGYYAVNGAVHDAAIAAWGIKADYDYIRPISTIRYMGSRGQSTDLGRPSYHVDGLPLETNLVEEITFASASGTNRHAHLSAHIGKIAIYCWPGEPADPLTEYSGAAWILATTWLPYQRDTFVTPAFAGYPSGHSCFSRAAAEVMAAFTGSAFFPGGIGAHTVATNSLAFELGPSTGVTLQWATYFDAADEAGISRLYGGIHVAVDDGPARVIGSQIGQRAYQHASQYWDRSILDAFRLRMSDFTSGSRRFVWPCVSGVNYQLQSGPSPDAFTDTGPPGSANGPWMEVIDTSSTPAVNLFRVIRE